MTPIEKEINKVIDRFTAEDQRLEPWIIDENDNQIYLEDELNAVFRYYNEQYSVEVIKVCDECSYVMGVVTIAWLEEGKLYVANYIWEIN